MIGCGRWGGRSQGWCPYFWLQPLEGGWSHSLSGKNRGFWRRVCECEVCVRDHWINRFGPQGRGLGSGLDGNWSEGPGAEWPERKIMWEKKGIWQNQEWCQQVRRPSSSHKGNWGLARDVERKSEECMSLKSRKRDVSRRKRSAVSHAFQRPSKERNESGFGLAKDTMEVKLWAKEWVWVEKGRQMKPTLSRRLDVMGRRESDSGFKEELFWIREIWSGLNAHRKDTIGRSWKFERSGN